MNRRRCFFFFMLMGAVIVPACSSLASGFRITEPGALALGVAGALVAQGDDPSILPINPAGIGQLTSPGMAVGETLLKPVYRRSGDGEEKETDSTSMYLPGLYLTDTMGTPDWAFGLGFYYPYGFETRWGEDSFARYAATKSSLRVLAINPALTYKLSDGFWFGAGLDYYRAELELNKKLWRGLGEIDGDYSAEADGKGWGYSLGMLIKFGPRYSLGLAYRSGVKVDFDGDVDSESPLGKFSTGMDTNIHFPAGAQLGFAARIISTLVVEMDVEWTDWSNFDRLNLAYNEPSSQYGIPEKSIRRQNWQDTYAGRIGVRYGVSPANEVRAGFIYETSPVSNSYYDPILPDGDHHWGVSLGYGYRQGRVSVDLAYQTLWLTKRSIDAPNDDLRNQNTGSADPLLGGTDTRGSYEGLCHLVALSLSFLF